MRALIPLVALITACPLIIHGQAPPPLLARPPERLPAPTVAVTMTGEDRCKVAVSHPTPRYPTEARRDHITGKGLYHLHVSYETGEVMSVDVLKSTGHRILDDAAVATLKQWKCRPHTVIGLKIPITFSISQKT
jgi:protein TonB